MDLLGLTEQLSNYIIRPPRAEYSINDLGETVFEYKGIIYERNDFTVPPSSNNKKLQCSIYLDRFNKNTVLRPTVLYLHANSSSRLTVKNYLKILLPRFDVVAFDFRACGLSQGTYLTLGYLQKQDVKAVLQYVDSHFGKRKYLIWGRSMGAVTAILYTAKYEMNSERIASLVLDSPFADLQKIIHFLADQKAPLVPSFMVESVIDSIQQHTKQKIQKEYNKQFLIRKHKPINQISKIKIPIFFVGSKKDQLVDCTHLQQYYDKAFCYKEMQILQGGHNQIRPDHLKLAIVQFLIASLSMKRDPTVRKKIFGFGQKLSSPFGVERSQSVILNQPSNVQQNQLKLNNAMDKVPQIPPSPQIRRKLTDDRLWKQAAEKRHQAQKSNPKDPQIVPSSQKKSAQKRLWKNNSINNSINQLSQSQFNEKQQQKAQQKLNNNTTTKQQIKDKTTLITHQQILDKVLPKNSTRRANRIFTNNHTNIFEELNKYKQIVPKKRR